MISIATLQDHLADRWVAFDKHGAVLEVEIPNDIGPAAFLVSPVTDALKEVDDDGFVTGPVDRSRMWAVDAIVLNEIALRRLGAESYSASELIEAVRRSGLTWQVRPTSPVDGES